MTVFLRFWRQMVPATVFLAVALFVPVASFVYEVTRRGLLGQRGPDAFFTLWVMVVGVVAFAIFAGVSMFRWVFRTYRKEQEHRELLERFRATFGVDFVPGDQVERRAAQMRVDLTLISLATRCLTLFEEQEQLQSSEIDPTRLNESVTERRRRLLALALEIREAKEAFYGPGSLAIALGFQVRSLGDYDPRV